MYIVTLSRSYIVACTSYQYQLLEIYEEIIDLRENIPYKYDNPTTTHRFVKVFNDPQLVKS